MPTGKKAYAYLDEYSDEGEVFYSRSLSYKGFAEGSPDCVFGHDGEVSEHTIESLREAGAPLEYFPYIQIIVDQNIRFRQSQLQIADSKGYSLITNESDDYFTPFRYDTPGQYGYTLMDSFNLQLGNMPYEVQFYTR